MELKYKEFKNIEELEFEILEEIELIEFNEELNNIGNLFYSTEILKVVGNNNNKNILLGKDNIIYLIDNHFEVGDFLTKSGVYSSNNFIKINKDSFDKKFIEEMEILINKSGIVLNIEDFTEITKEKIEEKINNEIIKNKLEFEEKEKLEKIESETREETERRKKEQYEKDNILSMSDNHIEIKENEIVRTRTKYILNKNINLIIDYSEFNCMGGYSNSRHIDCGVEEFLFNNKITYTKFIKEKDNWIKVFKLDFEKGEINEVRIPKSKFLFVLSKINTTNNSKENIKLWKNLTGMKLDFLDLQRMEFKEDTFPIQAKILNKDWFEITFMNKTENFDWDNSREIFFKDGGSRSVKNYFWGIKDFLDFTQKFKLTKQEVFNYTKKLKMLKKLK